LLVGQLRERKELREESKERAEFREKESKISFGISFICIHRPYMSWTINYFFQ